MFLELSNHHFRMICEGSCDTEGWSSENGANKLRFNTNIQIENRIVNCNNISQY